MAKPKTPKPAIVAVTPDIQTEVVGIPPGAIDSPTPDPSLGNDGAAAAGEGQPSPKAPDRAPEDGLTLSEVILAAVEACLFPEAGEDVRPITLVIKGPAAGRWRAGRHFGPEPVTLTQDDLSYADVKALIMDPALTIMASHPTA